MVTDVPATATDILNCAVLYCFVLHCTVLYCSELWCPILHSTLLYHRHNVFSISIYTCAFFNYFHIRTLSISHLVYTVPSFFILHLTHILPLYFTLHNYLFPTLSPISGLLPLTALTLMDLHFHFSCWGILLSFSCWSLFKHTCLFWLSFCHFYPNALLNNNYHDFNNIAIDGGSLDCNINYFTDSNKIRKIGKIVRIYDTRI